MKRIISIFILTFLLNSCFGVTYNYYHRNELTGSYQIENIENSPEKYLFSYSKKDDKVIGYYYNSSIVKFIDVLDGNKIKKSTYYDKETGRVLYEKSFFYGENSEIKSFLYKQINEKSDVVYEMRSFFSKKDDKIIYNSTGFMINGTLEHHIIMEGLLTEDYRPLDCKTYGIIIDNKYSMAQYYNTEEIFTYGKSCTTSKLFQNYKLYESKRKYDSGKKKIWEEVIFNSNGKSISSKQYILDGTVLTQIMSTTSKTENVYDYSKIDDCCYILSYTDWDNTSAVKIEVLDETVYIKNEIIENLKYPIDLFSFSMF